MKKGTGVKIAEPTAPNATVQNVSEIVAKLWEEMPTYKRVIAKTRNNENIYGTYIKVPDILRRLQDIFGLGYDIDFKETVYNTDENNSLVVVRCEVGVETPSGYRTVSDYGSAKLLDNGRLNEQAFKAAATDALKRAVRWLGIGMFQYENDEPEVLRNDAASEGRTAKPKRDLGEEVAMLMATSPDKVEVATAVMAELGVYDPEEQDEEEALLEACQRFKATPKQLLWAFKDKRTGERFLEEFEDGKTVKQFMDELFAKK